MSGTRSLVSLERQIGQFRLPKKPTISTICVKNVMTFRKQPYIVVVLKVIQANGAFKCGFSDFEFFHGGVDEDRALVDDWADESAVQR